MNDNRPTGICDGCGREVPMDTLRDFNAPPVAVGVSLCATCADPPRYECACGQLAISGTGKCATCRALDYRPQGTQDHLFNPAPAQLAGQTRMEETG